tara:strand:- start:16 stop:288 length:273 start_codon:yes stop_codon:yes gene_type:complete
MPEPSDKMRETNVKFYDIINSEDWDLDNIEVEPKIDDSFTPPIMQYWMPTPHPKVFIRVDFTIEDAAENERLKDFLGGLDDFFNDEGYYG